MSVINIKQFTPNIFLIDPEIKKHLSFCEIQSYVLNDNVLQLLTYDDRGLPTSIKEKQLHMIKKISKYILLGFISDICIFDGNIY